jgi:hypothetical protein
VPSHRTRRDCTCWYQWGEPFKKTLPLNWCMMLRDSKGKRLKRADQARSDSEAKLLSKLQTESLKVHGNRLDPPKNAPATKKGK